MNSTQSKLSLKQEEHNQLKSEVESLAFEQMNKKARGTLTDQEVAHLKAMNEKLQNLSKEIVELGYQVYQKEANQNLH